MKGQIRLRRQIATVLLASDTPLTYSKIFDNWLWNTKVGESRIIGILTSHPEFIAVGNTFVPKKTEGGYTSNTLWTHLDHSLLSNREEE